MSSINTSFMATNQYSSIPRGYMVEKQSTYNRIDNIPPEKRWQPGESGNPAGRPPNKNSITYWYKKLLAEDKTAQEIAQAIVDKAKDGILPHAQEVTDRTDGKAGSDLAPLIDNRTLIINVTSEEAKKLLGEIAEGVRPHKGTTKQGKGV